jgi:hypothetical protein
MSLSLGTVKLKRQKEDVMAYFSYYPGRVDHDRKIRSRKQKTDIGKYSFVNRTIQLWNQLPANVLGTLSCKPSNFRKMVRKVINKAK